MVTHETYIAQIAALASRRLLSNEREAIAGIKLVYGAGSTGLRGITYYSRWNGNGGESAAFVEICAFGQESALQIAGTTIHELGHVLEHGAGHSGVWKAACERLGLRRVMAAGTAYKWSMFEPSLRVAICALAPPDDGEPVVDLIGKLGGSGPGGLIPLGQVLKPCGAGAGTRGGKSRGKGSGSRSRLYHCACEPPVKLRAASVSLACHCDHCAQSFALV